MITIGTKVQYNRIGQLARVLPREVSEIIQEAAEDAHDEARQNAWSPAKDALFVRHVNQFKSEVGLEGDGAIIGLVQEYGSGVHSTQPSKSASHGQPYPIVPKQASVLRFEVNGQVVFARKVMHPGVRPNPFLTPAVERSRKRMVARLRRLWRTLG